MLPSLVDKSMHPQYPSTGRSHLTAGLPTDPCLTNPFHLVPNYVTASRSPRSTARQTRAAPVHSCTAVELLLSASTARRYLARINEIQ